MSDFFDTVEHQLRDAAPALAHAGRAEAPARRRRHGAPIAIAAGAAVAVAVFVAGILLVGSGGSSREHSAGPVAGPPLVEWHDATAGLSVRVPATWHRATGSLTPHLVDPVERLSIGTYPLRAGPLRSCAQLPVGALQAAGARDVFFTLTERVASDHAHFPPRRRPFGLGPAITTETRGCVKGPVPWREHVVSFSDAGRQFSILAVIGTQASKARRAQLHAVIDSLQFTPGMAPHLPARH